MTHRLLLDVSSLGYRAYFGLRDLVRAPDGTSVGAVFGYLDMVTKLVVSRRPDEVVHVYDHDWRPTIRTQLYPGYKGNRPPEPDGLPEQFALLRRVLDLSGMQQAEAPGWEAEDAIGGLCKDAGDDDRFEMVSGDRDLIQLVRDPSVRLLFTVRGVSELLELDEAAVLAKYGVPASRYAEFAILRGDPSDALPGVARGRREDGARVDRGLRLARRAAGRRLLGRAESRTLEEASPRSAPDCARRGITWRPCDAWSRSRSTRRSRSGRAGETTRRSETWPTNMGCAGRSFGCWRPWTARARPREVDPSSERRCRGRVERLRDRAADLRPARRV